MHYSVSLCIMRVQQEEIVTKTSAMYCEVYHSTAHRKPGRRQCNTVQHMHATTMQGASCNGVTAALAHLHAPERSLLTAWLDVAELQRDLKS